MSALFVGVFLTPAAYYMAIRLSFPLAGLLRHRPFTSLLGAAVGLLLLLYAVRGVTLLAGSGGSLPVALTAIKCRLPAVSCQQSVVSRSHVTH